MRLGYLYEPGKAGSNYRSIIPMNALEKRGHTILRPSGSAHDVPLRELAGCDLVHCFRREDRLSDIASLSRRGVAISFDNDDDLAASDMIGGKSSLSGLRVNRKRSADFAKLARMADLVTTPSPVLAEHYRESGAEHVAVLENCLDRGVPHFGFRERHEGLVIGWVAALEHAPDAASLQLVETLGRLLQAHANLRVLTVGVRLALRSERYEHLDYVNHLDLLKTTSRIDIGIAPLVDNAFNRARSNIKLKEYGAGGAAWLASPVGPYLELGSGQGGELVGADSWFETLDRLVRSTRQRRKLARRALRWAKTQTIDSHVAAWESEFELAIERAQTRMSIQTGPTAASMR